MPDVERDANISGFLAGKYRAMVNNGILTTGFDFPGIDLIGMLRPTKSPSLWVQMLGRGTRPVYAEDFDLLTTEGRLASIAAGPKQNCLVLDFAGNTLRLGPINDPVLPKRKGEGGGGIAPVKLCPVCGTYNHASVRYCVSCGNEFPKEVKIKERAGTEELLASSTPIFEVFKVDRVVYGIHRKEGSPPSLRVEYFSGLRMFKEWHCFEHSGVPRKKARDFWRENSGTEPPESVDEAIIRLPELRTPTGIRVELKPKYDQVLYHYYNGEGT
jgi:DNA repair protein RadD